MVSERTNGDALRRIFQSISIAVIFTCFIMYKTDKNIYSFINDSTGKGLAEFIYRIKFMVASNYIAGKLHIIFAIFLVLSVLIYSFLDFLSRQMGVKK